MRTWPKLAGSSPPPAGVPPDGVRRRALVWARGVLGRCPRLPYFAPSGLRRGRPFPEPRRGGLRVAWGNAPVLGRCPRLPYFAPSGLRRGRPFPEPRRGGLRVAWGNAPGLTPPQEVGHATAVAHLGRRGTRPGRRG